MMDLYQVEVELATVEGPDPRVIGRYGLTLFADSEAAAETQATHQFDQLWEKPTKETGIITRVVRTVKNGELNHQPWPKDQP
jgi:hypothetical protein